MVEIGVDLIGESYKGNPLAAADDLACLVNLLLIARCLPQVA